MLLSKIHGAGQKTKHTDWKLEGSARETDARVPQEQEAILEDTGEDSVSESFQLRQIDVECERRKGETLPAGSAVGCSENVQRKQRHWEKIVAAKKSKRKQEKERRKANRVENSGNNQSDCRCSHIYLFTD